MSIYFDAITTVLSLIVLVRYSHLVVRDCNGTRLIGLMLAATYLLAQSSWTAAWFMGNSWGRDWANYVWFLFNSLVFILLVKISGDEDER